MIKGSIIGVLFLILFGCGTQGEISKENAVAKVPVKEKEIVKREEPFFQVQKDTGRMDSTLYNQYKNGQKEGLWRETDKNGVLLSEGYYKNGKANGLMKWYHEGRLMATGTMMDDQRNGPWKICDVNDPLFCIDANFINESREGVWKIYHKSGELWKEQIWKNDQVVSETCWDKNGESMVCEPTLKN